MSATATPDKLMETAADAARAGARVISKALESGGEVSFAEKGTNDFVTTVDRESEAAVVELIRRRHPDHGILAEESPESDIGGDVRWVIDPLDGTTNFIHGFPVFSVSVAAARSKPGPVRAEDVLAGAIYDPLRDEMFLAAEGAGAELNGRKIAVSKRDRLESSLLLTGFPFRAQQLLDTYLSIFADLHKTSHGIRRAGSAALDLAYVACGRAEAFFEFSLSPWDMAAGAVIVREAGGIVRDFEGGGAALETGNIVAGEASAVAGILEVIGRHYP